MSKHISTTAELRALSAADLRKEIHEHAGEVAKQRLMVHARSEKDTAAFARSKKQLARMLTVLNQIEKTSTMSAPAASSSAVKAPKKKATGKKASPSVSA